MAARESGLVERLEPRGKPAGAKLGQRIRDVTSQRPNHPRERIARIVGL